MKLYNYFRSSASFRVRIALGLKQLPYDYVPVHIARGEHKEASFQALSPAIDRKSTRLNSSHVSESRMPSSA